MNKVQVVDNFIDAEEALFYKKLIDTFEKNSPDLFTSWQNGKRIILPFGNVENDIKDNIIAQPDLKILGENEKTVRNLFLRLESQIRQSYNLQNQSYVCCFWLAKQYSGSNVPVHDDTDGGTNVHFEESSIVYLNTLESGGELNFPDLDYHHKPKIGDLVFFPTKTSGKHEVKEILEDRYSLVFWTSSDKNFKL
jgi:hypothetical protein